MKKWFRAAFGLFGYAFVILYYSSASRVAQGGTRHYPWSTCISCVDVNTFGDIPPTWNEILLLIAPLNALVYLTLGLLLGLLFQRLRRVPDRRAAVARLRLSKSFALAFGVYGYLHATWFYVGYFWPAPESLREFLWAACPACIRVLGGVSWRGIILFVATANALMYAAAGFLIGLLIESGRRFMIARRSLPIT